MVTKSLHGDCPSAVKKRLSGKTLVLGSTVVDVIVKVPRLPATAQDVNIISQHHQLGGCAYNVAHILRLAGVPHQLCSPVGCGMYGDFVARSLEEKRIPLFVRMDEVANGCCYCLVEPSGERTFLSHHGAEYLFRREWFTPQVLEGVASIYICGLELEETTSPALVDFLEELVLRKESSLPKKQGSTQDYNPPHIFFAPGPRITAIDASLMDRILGLSPIVHLNESEIQSFTGEVALETAMEGLFQRTRNSVVVTRGERGACCIHQGHIHHVNGNRAVVVDTIGAGDAHIGSVIAALHQGLNFLQAVRQANAVAAAVVSIAGASLTQREYNEVMGKTE